MAACNNIYCLSTAIKKKQIFCYEFLTFLYWFYPFLGVGCWFSCMPWKVLRPNFRSCQVESTTCTSRCALPNSTTTPVLISLSPWQVFLRGLDSPSSNHVRQQSALSIFLWRTYSCINLRCRFILLMAWLPTSLDTVLDSLPYCAPLTHLTLLQTISFLRSIVLTW